MIEESLFKTNYLGRDGFRWWVGQVAPNGEYTEGQSNGGGWGNRVKVRILGYHPYSVVELPNKDLPWAQCLLSTTAGSGARNQATSVKVSPGDTVFGFFLDGDNAQVPVIIGVFGRTSQVPSADFASPFVPFTGRTERVKNDGSLIANSESNEQNSTTQPSPVSVDKKTADKINAETNPENDPRLQVNPASNVIGQKVTVASTDKDSAVQKIKNETENFVSRVTNITDGIQGALDGANQFIGEKKQLILGEIDGMVANVQNSATRMVQDMTKNLSDAMIPVLNGGLQVLYDQTYALVFAATQSDPAATKAGTVAQALLIGPVKKLSDAFPCMANNIINGLGDMIKGVLTNVVDNVTNFVSCIGDQVVGALMNHIIGGVTKFIQPLLGGLDKILMGFSPLNFLRSTADAILGLGDKLGCNEIAPEFDLASNEWVIGKGTSDKVGVPVNEILETANNALTIGESAINVVQDIAAATGSLGVFDFANPSVSVPGFDSALGNCYAGPPELGGCGGTKVKIFGGGKGIGGVANAILQLSDAGRGVTGSLIGVDLVNGGGGYTFPPFVEIVDECGRGRGGTARAIVDYDPDSDTFQQITDIYIESPGEQYTPSEDTKDYVTDDQNGPIIVKPGKNYNPEEDIIKDNIGGKYSINTDSNGSITKVIRIPTEDISRDDSGDSGSRPTSSVKRQSIQDTLEFNVVSEKGSGAILRPRLIERPKAPQGEIKQVIDCISKEDDIVGYVDGKPYTGPFHIHPSTGRKMVGAFHTETPHQYIFDTPEESLGSVQVNTVTNIPTTTSTTSTPTTETTTTTTTDTTSTSTAPPTSTSSGGGGGTSSSTPTPTPTPPPSPPTPPPSSGSGGYGGGY